MQSEDVVTNGLSAPENKSSGARPVSKWCNERRLALALFVLVEFVTLVMYGAIGRRYWFYFDEWDLLASRGLSIRGLLTDHGGHCVALPTVIYRCLFYLFGLRSYLPYQAITIALHVAIAALLRSVMRRSGVRPSIATAAACLFALFGTGSQNIVWAFQMTLTGALALGLVHLLLIDHDGPFDRRDALGLLAGFLALACSGVGAVMVGVVAITAVIRRGWRAAALHSVPPAAAYAAWMGRYRVKVTGRVYSVQNDKDAVVDFTRRGFEATFDSLGQIPGAGWVLAGVLVAGFVVACTRRHVPDFRHLAAKPVALLAGAGVFLLMTAVTRSSLRAVVPSSGKYVYVTAALLLVPLAAASEAVVRFRRWLLPVAIAVFVAGVPGNIAKSDDWGGRVPAFGQNDLQRRVVSLARMPLASDVPRSLRPLPHDGRWMTVGWLLSAEWSGRLPGPRVSSPRQRATDALRLSLEQLDTSDGRVCPRLSGHVVLHLDSGDELVVNGSIWVRTLAEGDQPMSQFLMFGSSFGSGFFPHTLVDVAGPLTLEVSETSMGGGIC